MFPDSFFAPDSRIDSFGGSEFSGLYSGGLGGIGGGNSGFSSSGRGGLDTDARRPGQADRADDDADEGGAVVVDSVPTPSVRSR